VPVTRSRERIKEEHMIRRTEIIVEVDRVFLVGRNGLPLFAWCHGCAREVRMLTPEQTATVTRHSARAIYRWVEADAIHHTEDARGNVLVCLDTLPPAKAT
jgi:hypothetical protein